MNFQRIFRPELLSIFAWKKLKSQAVPSLFILGSALLSVSKSFRQVHQEAMNE
ncbi:Hypothetical protein FKW44_012441 [Caligus rogercresseyi]|uniref:Uncharacterized protein n=1 Tax=Caligus rogercresseyi TaxID=217165 RepID=A0A7T8HJD8_CALRO|nr:Hypothetical protein FKW44_012441 [Caligus rogercresseyi]